MKTRTFKAGDTVKHGPTGETWLLIRDEDDGKVFPGGWPATMANASDCTLVSPIEDAPERLQAIFDTVQYAERQEAADRCGMCDGTGVSDGYEHDPNWYQPGETCPCPACGGTGR